MSADVETAFMGGGVAAWWDRQRQYVQAELMEPEEALAKGQIDWGVDKVPVEWLGEETGYHLLVRDKDDAVLSCVGDDFVPLQNYELMDILTAITKAGRGLKIESAMSLKGGKVVAICARRPDPVKIASEEHLQYLTGANWHGQGRRAVVYPTDIRTVCANTLNLGMAVAKRDDRLFKFVHRGDMQANIERAKEVLDITFEYQDEFVRVGNKMATVKMSASEFEKFLRKAQPADDSMDKASMTRVMNTREGIKRVYNDSPDLQNLRGTTWGALQATAEFFDHRINFQSPDNRFLSSLTGHNGELNRAFEVLNKEYQLA